MKKRVMLAMAIIMLLGSVKAMAMSAQDENVINKTHASEEDMMMNDPDTQYLAINAATKIEANMADLGGKSAVENKSIALNELRTQIMMLKEKAPSLEAVVVINGKTRSAGQALSQAELIIKGLETNFSEDKARILAKDLNDAITSVKEY
ncbi:hypothetical protein B9G69_006300 [Bdellovibrio sp. SKB1291214]|uniref:hypothetical protein n=1 Tax=Bdellovibrio sp. SKB1291214 TaxID=1732569 RepID=UPI000B516F10|nr:hypothetical protein [Bdellovibrio sp. SKB1291214]UYL10188.1 hypothetical protein B9G69_006300 [Bdellovibrio sp. SKB1291214]